MDDNNPLIDIEIDEHKTELKSFVDKVSSLTIPDSHKGVCDRFVRDCDILMKDVESKDTPSAADLCDYQDRRNSLEIQYNNILQDI